MANNVNKNTISIKIGDLKKRKHIKRRRTMKKDSSSHHHTPVNNIHVGSWRLPVNNSSLFDYATAPKHPFPHAEPVRNPVRQYAPAEQTRHEVDNHRTMASAREPFFGSPFMSQAPSNKSSLYDLESVQFEAPDENSSISSKELILEDGQDVEMGRIYEDSHDGTFENENPFEDAKFFPTQEPKSIEYNDFNIQPDEKEPEVSESMLNTGLNPVLPEIKVTDNAFNLQPPKEETPMKVIRRNFLDKLENENKEAITREKVTLKTVDMKTALEEKLKKNPKYKLSKEEKKTFGEIYADKMFGNKLTGNIKFAKTALEKIEQNEKIREEHLKLKKSAEDKIRERSYSVKPMKATVKELRELTQNSPQMYDKVVAMDGQFV